jgi:hypothetical protein
MVHGDGRQLACGGGGVGHNVFLSRQPHDLAPVPVVRSYFHEIFIE